MTKHKLIFIIPIIALITFSYVVASNAAQSQAQRFSGKLLIDNINPQRLWYVSPVNHKRYDLGTTSNQAIQTISKLVIGINNVNLKKIPTGSENFLGNSALRQHLNGHFLLAVEQRGSLWYVSPSNLKRYYFLKNDESSFAFFRGLALNISEVNLQFIPIAFTQPSLPITTPTGCVYNNPSCSINQFCQNNLCIPKPQTITPTGCTYGNPACDLSHICINNSCVLKDGCAYNNPSCPQGQQCISNECKTVVVLPPSSPACNTPACLDPRKPQLYEASAGASMSTPHGLGVGEIWQFGPHRFMRVESLSAITGTPDTNGSVSFWTDDQKGCRLYDTHSINPYKGLFPFGDIQLVVYTLNQKVYADAYSGALAYPVCIQFSTQPWFDCAAFPGSGSYTLSDGNVRRIYSNPDYTPAESIFLDVGTIKYQLLTGIFPSLSTAYSLTGLWRFIEFAKEKVPENFAGITVFGDVYTQDDATSVATLQSLSTDVSAYNQARSLVPEGLNHGLDYQQQEWHELGHAAFFSTQGYEFADPKYAVMINEGRANFIQGIANWGEENERFVKNRYCGETTYRQTDGGPELSYAANIITDPVRVGQCFHMTIWNACGNQAINDAFAEILDQPFYPHNLYPHYFEIFEKYCPDKIRARQIIKNFSIDDYVLTQQSPLVKDLLPGTACN